jgi:hypothetical protein
VGGWRSAWIGPEDHVVVPFVGHLYGDRIVLEETFESGILTRWMFFDIKVESIHWSNADSDDGGAKRALCQEMSATRTR